MGIYKLGRALVLCCALLCILASSSSASQMIWSFDAGSRLPYAHFKLDAGDAPYCQIYVNVTVNGVHDDYRNTSPDLLAYAGNAFSLSRSVGSGTSIPNPQLGDVISINPNGQATMFYASTVPHGAWPSGMKQGGGGGSGKYLITCSVTHADGHIEASSIVGYTAGGSMTDQQPGPQYQEPTPVPTADSGGIAANTQQCRVLVNCKYVDTYGKLQPYLNATCTLQGSTPLSQSTGSDGLATFDGINVSAYILTIVGTHPTSANTSVVDSATKTVGVKAGSTTSVTVVFGNDGIGKIDVSDPNTANGAGGGTPFPVQSWWQQMLSSVFVPQQSNLDAVKGDLSTLVNWGPFGFVAQLITAINTPTSGSIGLAIPAMVWNPIDQQWQTAASGNSTSIDISGGMSTNSSFQVLRGFMGAFVWLAFAVGIGIKLMPKQVV